MASFLKKIHPNTKQERRLLGNGANNGVARLFKRSLPKTKLPFDLYVRGTADEQNKTS